jgi:membrane fusion protein (multidrug efflux system)
MSLETLDGAPKPRRVVLTLGVVAIAATTAVFFGVTTRARSKQEVSDWTNEQAMATVRLVQPEHGAPEDSLVLPGNINANYVATLFARATGYVTTWNSDIGAHVSKGQILAVIAAPDLDQQLEEAKAQLFQLNAAVQQAQANADLGKVTDQRTSKLVSQGWSSQAQGDTDRLTSAARDAALAVAKANVLAQQAAVNRLTELAAFEQVKAPFDGVVTARNVDIGNLVTANGASGAALFQVADIHRMRIYVNVPQAFLGELHPGIKATLNVPGQPEAFNAELVSTSNALAVNSRTGLVELQADNPDGKLWPGAFAEVHFLIPADPNTLSIPSTALIFGSQGMQVATLNSGNKVDLKSVVLGRDLGNKVEIQSGLTIADRLVDNPMESIKNGDEVRIADTDRKAAGTIVSDKID